MNFTLTYLKVFFYLKPEEQWVPAWKVQLLEALIFSSIRSIHREYSH